MATAGDSLPAEKKAGTQEPSTSTGLLNPPTQPACFGFQIWPEIGRNSAEYTVLGPMLQLLNACSLENITIAALKKVDRGTIRRYQDSELKSKKAIAAMTATENPSLELRLNGGGSSSHPPFYIPFFCHQEKENPEPALSLGFLPVVRTLRSDLVPALHNRGAG